MKIDKLEEKYINLWKRRELVILLKPETDWDKLSGVSKEIHREINDFFQEIKNLEISEKSEVYNRLSVRFPKLLENDNLFRRSSLRYLRDNLGWYKFVRRVYDSTRTALTNGVKLIDFDLRKSTDSCNCALKQEIRIRISKKPSESISKIQAFTDGYYRYELHKCKKCNTFWINDLFSDDGPQKGWRKPDNKYELELIKKYLQSNPNQ